jgi:hypothetical protein
MIAGKMENSRLIQKTKLFVYIRLKSRSDPIEEAGWVPCKRIKQALC